MHAWVGCERRHNAHLRNTHSCITVGPAVHERQTFNHHIASTVLAYHRAVQCCLDASRPAAQAPRFPPTTVCCQQIRLGVEMEVPFASDGRNVPPLASGDWLQGEAIKQQKIANIASKCNLVQSIFRQTMHDPTARHSHPGDPITQPTHPRSQARPSQYAPKSKFVSLAWCNDGALFLSHRDESHH